MVRLASIELNADQDVAKGKKTSISPLFANADLWKNFKLLENVEGDKTRINITIAKAGSFQTKASISRKQGDDTNLCVFLNRSDITRKITATDDIKKGEKLTVTLEKP